MPYARKLRSRSPKTKNNTQTRVKFSGLYACGCAYAFPINLPLQLQSARHKIGKVLSPTLLAGLGGNTLCTRRHALEKAHTRATLGKKLRDNMTAPNDRLPRTARAGAHWGFIACGRGCGRCRGRGRAAIAVVLQVRVRASVMLHVLCMTNGSYQHRQMVCNLANGYPVHAPVVAAIGEER